MTLDDNGDVVVVGRMHETGREDELATFKFRGSDGELMWNAKEGGAARLDDRALAVACGDDGDPVVAGLIQNGDGTASLMVVRYAGLDGGVLWTVTEANMVNDQSGDGWAAIDAAGDAVVAWKSWGGATSYDIRVVKYDGVDGTEIWSRTYHHGGSSADDPAAMTLDADGNVLLVGATAGDFLTVKLSGTDGTTIWASTYAGPQAWYDVANAVAVAADGTVVVSGFSDGIGTGWDVATIGYDPGTGKQAWVERWNGASDSTDESRSLALGTDGRLYVSGYSYNASTGMDALTLAYELSTTTDAPIPLLGPALTAAPNPFNPRVNLSFALEREGAAVLSIRDLRGRVVAVLHDGILPEGPSEFAWDGRDGAGREQSAGIYLAELRTAAGVSTRKLGLVR